MNEPHENLDHDPFADDAARRPSRLRRSVARDARRARRARCAVVVASADAPGSMLPSGLTRRPLRHVRPCPHAPRGPLR